MPSKTPTRKLVARQEPNWKIDYLLTGKLPPETSENAWDLFDWQFLPPREGKDLWLEQCGTLLKSWLRKYPGTRPFAWWVYTAPEPRQQIGGSGKPKFAVLAYSKSYTFGLPNNWVAELGSRLHQDSQKVQAAVVDMADPPTFESQAAYLDRLGLLLDSEKDKADFSPEVLKINPETGRLIRD